MPSFKLFFLFFVIIDCQYLPENKAQDESYQCGIAMYSLLRIMDYKTRSQLNVFAKF